MLKRLVQNLIKIIQKILIVILLTIVYFLGFGFTLIFLMFFNRKILTGPGKDSNTFWIKAEGYRVNAQDSVRQS